jgi:hypothetical protein
VADLFKAGEGPTIGKAAALIRFDGLDAAVVSIEQDAGTIGSFGEGEA